MWKDSNLRGHLSRTASLSEEWQSLPHEKEEKTLNNNLNATVTGVPKCHSFSIEHTQRNSADQATEIPGQVAEGLNCTPSFAYFKQIDVSL